MIKSKEKLLGQTMVFSFPGTLFSLQCCSLPCQIHLYCTFLGLASWTGNRFSSWRNHFSICFHLFLTPVQSSLKLWKLCLQIMASHLRCEECEKTKTMTNISFFIWQPSMDNSNDIIPMLVHKTYNWKIFLKLSQKSLCSLLHLPPVSANSAPWCGYENMRGCWG